MITNCFKIKLLNFGTVENEIDRIKGIGPKSSARGSLTSPYSAPELYLRKLKINKDTG